MSNQNIGIIMLAIAALAVFLLFHYWRKTRVVVDKKKKGDEWPYVMAREGHLMTDGEWHVHDRLAKAMPGCHIFAQVSLSHLLQVKEGAKEPKGINWVAKIDGVVVDFVVCDGVGKVLAVVELGNASESQDDQRKSNEDKDKALAAAGVRVSRWTMRTMPKSEDINKLITAPRVKTGVETSDADQDDRLPILS